jgi:hypothetical protein
MARETISGGAERGNPLPYTLNAQCREHASRWVMGMACG